MNKIKIFLITVSALTVLMLSSCSSASLSSKQVAAPLTATSPFITRNGTKLMEGEKEFRFISVNVPNYFILEDKTISSGEGWHRTTTFEQKDAVKAVSRLGGQAFRTYVFSVEGGVRIKAVDKNIAVPLAHIYADKEGKIVYNEDLFMDVDRGLAIAAEEGVRLIIPFVDEWEWFGGAPQWAQLTGAKDFWTDEKAISAFKDFITFVLNRKNTVTGIAYKDDPVILAWELGNELGSAPDTWRIEIAAHIKSIDKNHLVMDGGYKTITDGALDDPNIDILTTHYEDDAIADRISQAAAVNKPYIYGEFQPTADFVVQTVVDSIIDNGGAGAMVWSLRFRTDFGGFYYHNDFNNNASDSLQYPGFQSTKPSGEEDIFIVLRKAAFQIRGMKTPKEAIPEAPVLLPIADPSVINWQGSAGALDYVVERMLSDGKWKKIADKVSDAEKDISTQIPFAELPLFNDKDLPTGTTGTISYRVKARNKSGYSEYSNVVTVTK